MTPPVEIDPATRRARVPAGTPWGTVAAACAAHGLAAPHGAHAAQDAVDFLLDGGLGVYGRCHGLAANHVRAVTLAGGRRIDPVTDPDGFWAMRGGGAVLGPVGSVEVGLFDAGPVLAGRITWPIADAAAVLCAWLAWTRDAPRSVTTTATLLHPAGGAAALVIAGAALDHVDGAALLARLRGAAPPAADTWRRRGPGVVPAALGSGTPPRRAGLHALLGELDEQAVGVLLRIAGRQAPDPPAAVELHQLGGALAVAPPDAGIRGRVEGRFALAARGAAATLAALHGALAPWDTGRALRGLAAAGCSPRRCFGAPAALRLAAIRARGAPIPD